MLTRVEKKETTESVPVVSVRISDDSSVPELNQGLTRTVSTPPWQDASPLHFHVALFQTSILLLITPWLIEGLVRKVGKHQNKKTKRLRFMLEGNWPCISFVLGSTPKIVNKNIQQRPLQVSKSFPSINYNNYTIRIAQGATNFKTNQSDCSKVSLTFSRVLDKALCWMIPHCDSWRFSRENFWHGCFDS